MTARYAVALINVALILALVLHLKFELWDRPSEDAQLDDITTYPLQDDVDDQLSHSKDTKRVDNVSTGTKGKTAIVVASQASENATWFDEYFPKWEKYIYRVDDPSAPLTVPKNKGRESMVYLTFMIDYYDDLPDHILFLHPTRYQWHNDDPDYDGVPMLRRFQFPYLESEGYVNIRCAWSLGCPAEIKPLQEAGEHRENVHAGGDYKKAFEVLFPGQTVPKFVGVSCCAQFAVTKEAVRKRQKNEYVRWRNWLMDTDLDDSISGRIMEYSWHMIFGKEPVHCPSAEACYCKVFGLCDLTCPERGSCEGRYILPPYSSLPDGWPLVGWDKKERERASPED